VFCVVISPLLSYGSVWPSSMGGGRSKDEDSEGVVFKDLMGSLPILRGAGLGGGIYKDFQEMFVGLKTTKTIEPDQGTAIQYKEAYQDWLENIILPKNWAQNKAN
jgi:hypothetical protein